MISQPRGFGAAINGQEKLYSVLATSTKDKVMLSTILIVILILFLIGALPNWKHSAGWGYGPSGVLGTILIIILILMLLGRL
jgi:hypothetical protein